MKVDPVKYGNELIEKHGADAHLIAESVLLGRYAHPQDGSLCFGTPPTDKTLTFWNNVLGYVMKRAPKPSEEQTEAA